MQPAGSAFRPGRLYAAVALLSVPLLAGQSAQLVPPGETRPSSPSTATQPGGPARPDPLRFADEIKGFAEWDRRNSFPADAVLFVGSSSIRLWATRESFGQWPVINRGFGGSHIADVSHYFERVVAPYKARVIVFYAGDNDIAAGASPETVRDDFAAFVRQVRAAQPQTPIVFLSIKPSMSRWEHWPRMQRANELVRGLCAAEPHLVFVDVAAALLGPDGLPKGEYYLDDKLHLSPVGYAVWTRELTPVLEKLLR